MADYRHIRTGSMPHDAVETHVNGWNEAGFSEGYGDHVFKRSVIVCNPNEGCVIKTQTIHGTSYPAMGEPMEIYGVADYGGGYPAMAEPMEIYGVTDYGGGYPAMGGPTKVYGVADYEGSSPAKGEPVKGYGTLDNGGSSPAKRGSVKLYGVADHGRNRPVNPPHHRASKTDEFISEIQTDAGRPSKTGSMSIMNWRQIPNSNGHGGSTDNEKDGSGTNIYGGGQWHSETAANGFHPRSGGYHGRNEMVTGSKQKPTMITEEGFTKPTNTKGTVADNWKEARKSPSVITSPILPVTEKPTQGRPIVPASVAPKEIFPSTIDSRKAARRYGGHLVSPQAIKERETYTPTIDSTEAALRYKGQIL